MMPRHLLSAVFASIWAVCASAAPEAQMLSAEEAADWQAVGRITVGGPQGRAFCTGTLIAPEWVLTAGHCVSGFRSADPVKAATLIFVAGLHNGEFATMRSARRVVASPRYQPGPLQLTTIPDDVALIELAQPITTIPPLPLAGVPPYSEDLGFVGYINRLPRAVALQTGCQFERRLPDLLLVGCPVVGGNSGAPLLVGIGSTPRVVGVISAQAPLGAYAARITDWVRLTIGAPAAR